MTYTNVLHPSHLAGRPGFAYSAPQTGTNFMQLQYDIKPKEHLEMVRTHRGLWSRIVLLYLGGTGVVTGIVAYQYLDRTWSMFLICLSFWVLVLDFLSPYIIHWRVYARNRRLFGPR